MMSPSCSTSAPMAGVGFPHWTNPHETSRHMRRITVSPLSSAGFSSMGLAQRGQYLNDSIMVSAAILAASHSPCLLSSSAFRAFPTVHVVADFGQRVGFRDGEDRVRELQFRVMAALQPHADDAIVEI